MQIFSEQFSGTDGGPPSTQAYKRAVYKQPPRHFLVQVLSPQKHGNAFSYGMHITPLHDPSDRRSIISRTSGNSGGSSGSSSGSGSASGSQIPSSPESTAPFTSEYEVWRRWEDCLFFQDTLEVQYDIMSREKRTRLHAGKGVKKNGLYEHEDPLRRLHRAASFESLPPGPDPTMIAKDVHDVLPRLTKKGTIFKASKDTIEQRGNEFKALIEALLHEGDDVPTLIVELRQLRVVRDFFGFWRRDHDRLERERHKQIGDKYSMRGRSESFSSRTSSVFNAGGLGMYFNASNLSLQLPSPVSPLNVSSQKAPRRPPMMQGGKGAMFPASATASEFGQINTPLPSRPRAQTIQGPMGYGMDNSHSAGFSNSVSSSSVHTVIAKTPASAPPGVTFMSATGDDGGYISDSPSVTESATSSQTFQSPVGSPRTGRMRSPDTRSHAQYEISGTFDGKGKGHAGNTVEDGPIIVSLEAGESLPFDEEAHMLVMREHEHLIPHGMDTLYEGMELRLGSRRGLQDLTITEEDEHDGYPRSEYQHSESSAEQDTRESMLMEEEHYSSVAPRPPRSVNTQSMTINRNAMFFRPPSSISDDGTVSSADNLSVTSAGRPGSPTSSTRSQTPVSSARIAAAHADALKALTGGFSRMRPTTPVSARLLSPSSASFRSSVQTSGSGSGSSGFAQPLSSIDTLSSYDVRPESFQSSVSCADLDSRLTSSSIIMHTPLFDQFEKSWSAAEQDQDSNEQGNTQHRTHDSISSVRTFMTDSSADAIISLARGKRSMSPAAGSPAAAPSGTNLRRSFSSGSRRPSNRMSQVSGLGDPAEEGDDLLDSYFYGFTSPATEAEGNAPGSPISPGREHFRSMLARPDNFPKPFQNRPPGQFHLPWTPPRPTSPGLPVSVRSSVLTVDSSFSIPTSVSPSFSSGSTGPTSPSYAPSISSSFSEEAAGAAISIKVVCSESIIAFRVERSMQLVDLRAKLRHKLVDQQGVALVDHFALAYKPAVLARVKELRASAGRSRSSSVSSVGITDPGSLRIIFSQSEWLDAVNSCTPGTKLTLHVLNG